MTEDNRSLERRIWELLGVVGVCLALAGAIDLALGLYPANIGDPEWEFGALGNFLNRLPLAVLGIMFVLSASLRRGARGWGVLWAMLLIICGFAVAAVFILFGTNVPLVLGETNPGARQTVIFKAMAKAGFQGVLYTLAFIGVGIYGLRAALLAKGRRSV